jgi:hypothetical protein
MMTIKMLKGGRMNSGKCVYLDKRGHLCCLEGARPVIILISYSNENGQMINWSTKYR